MKKKTRLIWYVIIGGFILMQAYPTVRPSVKLDNPADLLINEEVPAEIGAMLKSACYDCHSNESVYPWYSNVAPVKWLVYRDIVEGRKELNFSLWKTMSNDDQADILYEIAEEVKEGDMPMKIYPLTHPDAKLSDNDRKKLSDWAELLAENVYN